MARRPSYPNKTKLPPKPMFKLGDNLQISQDNHAALLRHITDRADVASQMRDQYIERYRVIDREVEGFLRLDQDDRRREIDNRKGQGPKPVDANLQLIVSKVEDIVTYIMGVTCPDTGMYAAYAPKEQQQVANAFALLMNQHGEEFEHYRHYCVGTYNAMKYNIGGWVNEWEERYGILISNDAETGEVTRREAVISQGNANIAFDPYNTLLDPAVSPIDINREGEFFATVEIVTKFKLQFDEQQGKVFLGKKWEEKLSGKAALSYYRDKPIVRELFPASAGNGRVDHISVLTAGANKDGPLDIYERMFFYCRIIPSKFGLSSPFGDPDKFQIWRFTVINGTTIVRAVHLHNAHGMLPIAVTMPSENNLGTETKSMAEQMIPLQRFASFQMNVKQRADRKKLYGVLVYDQELIPLMEHADALGGKVPARTPRHNQKSIRESFAVINDTPDTANVMRDIGDIAGLMDRMFPSDNVRQVADLERATKYQAAATVQSSNRRNHKTAKIVNDQAISKLRHMMMYNIYEFQPAIDLVDERTGDIMSIDPSTLRNTKLQFSISDGLKGIDRLMLLSNMMEITNMILQSAMANQQLDVIAWINYMTQLMGDKTDVNDFRIISPIDALPPEQKQLAFQLLQQATAEAEGEAPAQ